MAIFIMRGAFNLLLPPGKPVIAALASGAFRTYTITGTNTHFAQGTTTVVIAGTNVVGPVTVTSATSLTLQLTNNLTNFQPYSIVAITGTEEAVLPNGLVVQ